MGQRKHTEKPGLTNSTKPKAQRKAEDQIYPHKTRIFIPSARNEGHRWGREDKEHFAVVYFEDVPPAGLKCPSRDFTKRRNSPAPPRAAAALAENKHSSLLSSFQALSSRGEQRREPRGIRGRVDRWEIQVFLS